MWRRGYYASKRLPLGGAGGFKNNIKYRLLVNYMKRTTCFSSGPHREFTGSSFECKHSIPLSSRGGGFRTLYGVIYYVLRLRTGVLPYFIALYHLFPFLSLFFPIASNGTWTHLSRLEGGYINQLCYTCLSCILP